MLTPIKKSMQKTEEENPGSEAPLCPTCRIPLEEEWEEEVNEYGEKTGSEYEIYKCNKCGHKETL